MNWCSRFIMCRRLWEPSECFGVLHTQLLWIILQGSGTSKNHHCWVRTEPRLGSDPGVIPDQHFWFLWDIPGAQTFGGVSRSRMKIRFAPGECLVPLKAPCFEQKDLIPLLLFIFWGGKSLSFPKEIQTAGVITGHYCRTEVFWSCLLYLAQNSMFFICFCFFLNFLPYEGNNGLHKWAAEYEHLYFEIDFSDFYILLRER